MIAGTEYSFADGAGSRWSIDAETTLSVDAFSDHSGGNRNSSAADSSKDGTTR